MFNNWIFMHIDSIRKPTEQSHHTVGFYKEQGKSRKEIALLKPTTSWKPCYSCPHALQGRTHTAFNTDLKTTWHSPVTPALLVTFNLRQLSLHQDSGQEGELTAELLRVARWKHFQLCFCCFKVPVHSRSSSQKVAFSLNCRLLFHQWCVISHWELGSSS